MLSVSKPVFDSRGNCTVGVSFDVAGHPVVVNLRADRTLGAQMASWLGKTGAGGISFGAENPYAPLWRHVDGPIEAVTAVSSSPSLARLVQSVPYSAGTVRAVNQAVHAYDMIKKNNRVDVLATMLRDASMGHPVAQDALAKLRTVAQADQLRIGATLQQPVALLRFGALASGLSKGDPHAIEVYTVLDALHRKATGQAPLRPQPIHITHTWTGNEAPNELAAKLATAVAFGAAGASRLRMHLAYINAKPYRGPVRQSHGRMRYAS